MIVSKEKLNPVSYNIYFPVAARLPFSTAPGHFDRLNWRVRVLKKITPFPTVLFLCPKHFQKMFVDKICFPFYKSFIEVSLSYRNDFARFSFIVNWAQINGFNIRKRTFLDPFTKFLVPTLNYSHHWWVTFRRKFWTANAPWAWGSQFWRREAAAGTVSVVNVNNSNEFTRNQIMKRDSRYKFVIKWCSLFRLITEISHGEDIRYKVLTIKEIKLNSFFFNFAFNPAAGGMLVIR